MLGLGGISLSTSVSLQRRFVRNTSGQATVEAAFALPVLFVMLLLLLQPGIILYDRMVMEGAAAEGCRMLATHTSASLSTARIEELIKRRLGAVPSYELFHVHASGCSWDIQLEGDGSSANVSVRISNEIRLLPVLDVTASLLGAADSNGHIRLEVVRSATTQPDWVQASGIDPDGWVVRRL